MKIRFLFALIVLTSVFSCAKKEKHEKDWILQFYSASEDSLKKKAVIFLLEHISAHYSNESIILKDIDDKYRKEKTRVDYVYSYKKFSSVLKSVMENKNAMQFERIYDSLFVSDDYIIDNVEHAFKAWKNSVWSENVDFETFCEYILPYRVMDEPLDFDRSFFQKEYAPVISEERVMHGAFDSISMIHPVKYYRSMDEEFPYLMGVGLSHKVGIGNCVQQAVSEAMILRSVGIPATVDYVPQWGNYPGRHFMTKLVDNKNKSTFEMSLSDFKFVIPKDSLHESISGIQYVKIVPKVYRMTWSVQPDRLLLNSGDRTEKTGLFRNLCEKDVTDEYTECSTFRVQVKDTVEKIAYLCVFGRDGWTPVCASPIDGNEAVFEKIGRGIVYLPVLFRDEDSFQPIGNPFYFTDEGTYIALTGKGGKTQHAKLYSKYPVCSYTAVHTYRMKGGKFQGANTPGFSDAKTLFTIDYYPFYKQEIKIGSDEKFRYFRYLPPPNVIYSFSELQFYTQDENNSLKQMQGSYFEQHKSVGLDFASLSDNDLDTYVKGAPVKNSWLGYDTGKNNDSKLTKIVFAPQNDGNCIIPGYFYELSYWNNNKWNSLGIKRAKDHFLEYANLPQQALFWLKCHTRGKEERIFTLENGIQIWW